MGIFSRLFKKTPPTGKVNRKPLCAEEEQLCKAFPSELREDVRVVFQLFTRPVYYYGSKVTEVTGEYTTEFVVNNEPVYIPYRIYYKEVSDYKINSLSETQKTVLYCIFTRSHNGYLREKFVRKLLATDYPKWVMPFIVKLCDDYVLEIVTAIYDLLKDKDTAAIKQFCLQNKRAVNNSYNRMINYWYTYDMFTVPDFYEYVGRKLFSECLGYSRKMRRRQKHIAKIEFERKNNLKYLINKKQ